MPSTFQPKACTYFEPSANRDLEGIVCKHKLGPYTTTPAVWFKVINPNYSQHRGRRMFNRFRERIPLQQETQMSRQVAGVLYVVAMVAVIVGVDFAFFRNRFWERLAVNVGIVLVFLAFYFRFLRRP
jgi:hypothetical protein